MQEKNVDVAIVGAGTAGLNARSVVAKAGKSWVLIESGEYGTTCARVGCMPSKLLIAAADVAHEIDEAQQFGVSVDNKKIDGKAVMQRVRAERDRFVGFVVRDTLKLPEDQRLKGQARFTSANTLEIDSHTRVTAKSFVLATGSSAFIPPPFDAIREHVIINDDVFDWEDLPESVAVIGTGIIGLELGQALARLGVRVRFFSPFTKLGPFSDPSVSKVVQQQLQSELDLQLDVDVTDALPTSNGVKITWSTRVDGDESGAEHSDTFDQVLVAAGRRPNVAGLNLEAAGLALNDKGMPNWNSHTMQCGDKPIFLAGDASNYRPLLHEAADEGRIAGENSVLFPDVVAHERRAALGIAFTDPQMATVGQQYSDLEIDKTEIGEVSFEDQGRARVIGKNQGLLRLYADRECCTLLGAEMFGPRAEHLAHLIAWVIQQRLTVNQILKLPFYHPVIEEGLRTALRDLAYKLKTAGGCRNEDLAEAAGT